jgi:hypothetical protein
MAKVCISPPPKEDTVKIYFMGRSKNKKTKQNKLCFAIQRIKITCMKKKYKKTVALS